MLTTLALALLCIALVGLLVYRERVAKSDRQAAQELRHAIERDRIGERRQAAEERAQAAEERRELYQRIQAPEIAVQEAVRASRGDRPPRRPIAADDDRRYAERDGRG